LGERDSWSPECHPDVLSRLLDLWKNSRLPDVQRAARWAISSLPVIDRELKSLPEPDAKSIKFIKKQYKKKNSEAAFVIGFYWKKPWTDEELADIVIFINLWYSIVLMNKKMHDRREIKSRLSKKNNGVPEGDKI
jgi:hypothetical protein